jgi:hypothetical protein
MHNRVIYLSLRKFVPDRRVDRTWVPGNRRQERKQYRITRTEKVPASADRNVQGEDVAGEGALLLRLALFDILAKEKRETILAAEVLPHCTRSRFSQLHEDAPPKTFASVALERVQHRVRDERRWIHRIETKLKTNAGDGYAI